MQTLLTVLVTWLSVNFGLPATYDHPQVETVSSARMAAVRYRGLAPDRLPNAAVDADRSAPAGIGQDVYALYDDTRRIIYVREGWSGKTPADVSALVHELVHHLQNVAGMKFGCPQEREKDAYEAQRAWLALFDRTLEQEFEINPLMVLARTNCMF